MVDQCEFCGATQYQISEMCSGECEAASVSPPADAELDFNKDPVTEYLPEIDEDNGQVSIEDLDDAWMEEIDRTVPYDDDEWYPNDYY